MVVRRTLQVFTASGAIRAWATILIVTLGFGLALGSTIAYTAQSVRHSDRQWCDLLRGIDQPLPSNSPSTDRQRQFADTVHRLRVDKGC